MRKKGSGQYIWMALLFCLLVLPLREAAASGWRLDAPAEELLPRNLRLSSAALAAGTPLATRGLAQLHISGSAQPSQAGLEGLYQRLQAEGVEPVYLVDLREESHGFFAGAAISWYEEHNWGNRGRTGTEASDDEQCRLLALAGTMVRAVPLGREDTELLVPQELEAAAAVSEASAATAAGFRYVRFPATDQCWPEPLVVEAFLRFYQALPPRAWLHFHCQAGHGRTTIFMVLYDILRNPQLPLETIVLRQHLLGGTDLLAEAVGDDWLAVESRRKAHFLRRFYLYVQEQADKGFVLSWPVWLAQQSP